MGLLGLPTRCRVGGRRFIIRFMSVQVTVRNVPEAVRDELAARAARANQSLQAYLQDALEQLASTPTHDSSVSKLSRERRLKALRANLKGSKPAVSREDILRYIAEGRDRR